MLRSPAGNPEVAATPATKMLDQAGVTYHVHTYEHDPRADGYGLEAAEALGVDPHRVFKTLVAIVEGTRAVPVVAVVPVTAKADLKAVASHGGGKRAALAEPAAAERLTGYVVGGISPFGQKRPLPTIVDESAFGFPTVFCSGGRRGLEIELAPADFLALLGAVRADIQAR